MEKRYHIRLPKRVVAIDYGEKGDLYIRFRHADEPLGEPAKDGGVIFFYEDGRRSPVAVEILDVLRISKK